MVIFSRQTYEDVDIDTIKVSDFDLVQLKYDGHWCRLEFDNNGEADGYSRTNRVETSLKSHIFRRSVALGEHLFGTQWSNRNDRAGKIILFDLLVHEGDDISNLPYSQRLARLSYLVAEAHHPRLWLTQSWPARTAPQIWKAFVLDRDFEGVVFRRNRQVYADRLHRCKRDFEQTYFCTGFVKGQGKHADKLGAIEVGCAPGEPLILDNGKVATVGGGFTDFDRDYIWSHQDEFYGKQLDVVGKARFDSGALRHPNFVRWK